MWKCSVKLDLKTGYLKKYRSVDCCIFHGRFFVESSSTLLSNNLGHLWCCFRRWLLCIFVLKIKRNQCSLLPVFPDIYMWVVQQPLVQIYLCQTVAIYTLFQTCFEACSQHHSLWYEARSFAFNYNPFYSSILIWKTSCQDRTCYLKLIKKRLHNFWSYLCLKSYGTSHFSPPKSHM
jgi:hypothetical protein